MGRTEQIVKVSLYAVSPPLAERLRAQHGDAVRITVAGHRFPLDEAAVAAETLYPATQQTAAWPQGLLAEVTFDEMTLRCGDRVQGELLLTATTHPVVFASDQPLSAEFVDEQGMRLNDLSGMWMGTGWTWDLQPGQSGRVAFSASTHNSRLTNEPYVPPGQRLLIVPVPVHAHPDDNVPVRSSHLVAGPFAVTLRPTAAADGERAGS